MVRPYDEKELKRKYLLRNVLKMTQEDLAAAWCVSQAFVARLLASRGDAGDRRSIGKELEFVSWVNHAGGTSFTHDDLWPPHRDYHETPKGQRRAARGRKR